MKNIRNQKGITLVALIITIIVLLILAIVAISAVSGDDIIEHANDAVSQTKQAQAEEQAQIYLNEWKIQKYLEGGDFQSFLEEKFGENNVQYNEDGIYTLEINGHRVLVTEKGVISQEATSATGGVEVKPDGPENQLLKVEIGDFKYECHKDGTATVLGLSNQGISKIEDEVVELIMMDNIEYNGNYYVVTTIGNEAFYTFSGMANDKGCTNLELTGLPSGIISIGEKAFYGCSNLELTNLPNGVTSIGKEAFYGCTNLALTSLPSGVSSIGIGAFYNCTNLTLTSLPSGITSLGDNVFFWCSKITITEIPRDITSIGRDAFFNCSSLTKLTFKGTPDFIDSYAFLVCSNLVQINVPWGENDVEGAPWGASNAIITYNYNGQ